MELHEALGARSSVRAFKPDPVPRALLERVIAAGLTAPSKGNSQIWEFYAVAGEPLRGLAGMLGGLLRTEFIPAMQLGETSPAAAPAPGMEKARRRSEANRAALAACLAPRGIAVDDFMLQGTFTFFGAPAAILVMVEEDFSRDLPHILSVGAAVQNMLLAAVGEGLGACWIGGVWRYTPRIREMLGIGGSKKLLSSVALGWPDPDEQRVVWIRNTQSLNHLAVSTALSREIAALPGWRVKEGPAQTPFDPEGNLPTYL